MPEFTCNICGSANRWDGSRMEREPSTCASCGSNVRTRGLLQALSQELFGVDLAVPDFPRVKSLRGIGTSDANDYAARLAEKFDYRNTFYDREPRFDIVNLPPEEFGRYDFAISSEVMEHVPAPVENAFASVLRLLKPNGVFVFTVPYSLEASTREHFSSLGQFGFAEVAGKIVMVNRTPSGEWQVFDEPVFHLGVTGRALEMREFNQSGLMDSLAVAGFLNTRIYSDDYAAFGIVRAESHALPIAARKAVAGLSRDATRDVVEEWRALKVKFNGEMQTFNRSFWFRLGRKLRLF